MESQLAGPVTLESSAVTHREPLVAPESSAASPLLSLYFHMPPSTMQAEAPDRRNSMGSAAPSAEL